MAPSLNELRKRYSPDAPKPAPPSVRNFLGGIFSIIGDNDQGSALTCPVCGSVGRGWVVARFKGFACNAIAFECPTCNEHLIFAFEEGDADLLNTGCPGCGTETRHGLKVKEHDGYIDWQDFKCPDCSAEGRLLQRSSVTCEECGGNTIKEIRTTKFGDQKVILAECADCNHETPINEVVS